MTARKKPGSAREHVFTMRLNKVEDARLDALTTHYGLSRVAVIRMLLKRDADALEKITLRGG